MTNGTETALLDKEKDRLVADFKQNEPDLYTFLPTILEAIEFQEPISVQLSISTKGTHGNLFR
jgi:hypothetical protein